MKYAVAILSFFDNENKILFVDADSKAEALKKALVDIAENEETKQQQREWNDTLTNDYEELLDELVNGEMSCCVEEIR